MRNKGTLFYSVSQAKVLNEIYWQKGPVTFKLSKSLENSTGHGPGALLSNAVWWLLIITNMKITSPIYFKSQLTITC